MIHLLLVYSFLVLIDVWFPVCRNPRVRPLELRKYDVISLDSFRPQSLFHTLSVFDHGDRSLLNLVEIRTVLLLLCSTMCEQFNRAVFSNDIKVSYPLRSLVSFNPQVRISHRKGLQWCGGLLRRVESTGMWWRNKPRFPVFDWTKWVHSFVSCSTLKTEASAAFVEMHGICLR